MARVWQAYDVAMPNPQDEYAMNQSDGQWVEVPDPVSNPVPVTIDKRYLGDPRFNYNNGANISTNSDFITPRTVVRPRRQVRRNLDRGDTPLQKEIQAANSEEILKQQEAQRIAQAQAQDENEQYWGLLHAGVNPDTGEAMSDEDYVALAESGTVPTPTEKTMKNLAAGQLIGGGTVLTGPLMGAMIRQGVRDFINWGRGLFGRPSTLRGLPYTTSTPKGLLGGQTPKATTLPGPGTTTPPSGALPTPPNVPLLPGPVDRLPFPLNTGSIVRQLGGNPYLQ